MSIPNIEEKAYKSFVQTEIDSHKIVIFSKFTCPICKELKEKLSSVGIKYKNIEIGFTNNEAKIQSILDEKSGCKNLHCVFINGVFYNNCNDTLSLLDNKKLYYIIFSKSLQGIENAKNFVNVEIDESHVIIFSKTTCPYCKRIKDKFDSIEQSYRLVELDQLGDIGVKIQNELYLRTGQKTVPNIFINGKHIGGCDTTMKLFESGEMNQLLQSYKGSIQNPLKYVNTEIENNEIVIFSSSGSRNCNEIINKFQSLGRKFKTIDLNSLGKDEADNVRYTLEVKTDQMKLPVVFIHGKPIGEYEVILKLFNNGKIINLIAEPPSADSNSEISVADIIKKHKLVMFGKPGPNFNFSSYIFNYDVEILTEEMQKDLYERTGQKLPYYMFYNKQQIFAEELSEAETKFLDIEKYISENKIVMYSKTTCPFCKQAKAVLTGLNCEFRVIEIDALVFGAQIQQALADKTGQRTVPNIFIHGKHIGGCSDLLSIYHDTRIYDYLENKFETFDYDLCVIGGGSGGIAAAKEAASMNKKVVLFDFVTPSQHGTVWGLGGTCVNVGCIPKKLFHKASLLNEEMETSKNFGYKVTKSFDWVTLVTKVQKYIQSLNNNYVLELNKNNVEYKNAKAAFVNKHAVEIVGQNKQITSQNFIIAVGGRPSYPNIPGAHLGISSDDLFSLKENPGKVLLIGASYIALECAGFLNGLGYDTTVMVRSILLRGFDEDIANMIGDDLAARGVKFIKTHVPTELVDQGENKILVKAVNTQNQQRFEDTFNTVVFAIGRTANTKDLNLEAVGIKVEDNKKLTTTNEATSVQNIFAIGDVINNAPELTPVAIQAGKLLVRRMYKKAKDVMNYKLAPTTVFTPLEYGCIGYNETEAKTRFQNVVVYHNNFVPLENALESKPRKCYAKLICDVDQNEKVLGFHVLGPNAGEITQGYALGILKGALKSDFDALIGIHPTCAEVFTTLTVSKESKQKLESSGC